MPASPKLLKASSPEMAESQPELLARHCTEAGLIEKAAGLWGKAGQRSLARSAVVEAIEQLTRALAQIETLPDTPALRREADRASDRARNAAPQIKGYAALKPRRLRAGAFVDRAGRGSRRAPEDPLLLFSFFCGVWGGNYVEFNGDVMRELAAQFWSSPRRQGTTAPLMVGHRLMGVACATAVKIMGAERTLRSGHRAV